MTRAANGSGMVKFEFDDEHVTSAKGKYTQNDEGEDTQDGKSLLSNTTRSIATGTVPDDLQDFIVTYTPDGDMGEGDFEFRLPSGWEYEEVRVSGGEDHDESGNTVTVELFDHFGQWTFPNSNRRDDVEITFVNITVPDTHGEESFVARSKSRAAASNR